MLETILAFLVLLGAAVGVLLWRSLNAYSSEKGKSLATKEDIAVVTDKVEEVKTLYALRVKDLEHQNSIALESLRADHQLRMAAAEKRLAAHQEGFSLWRKLVQSAHSDDVFTVVAECQDWWEKNCLYLSATSRDSFNRAYLAASSHYHLTKSHAGAASMKENWQIILKAGDDLVAGVALPPLGDRESKSANEDGAAASSPIGAGG